jgi:hypothetical protein
MPLGEVPAASRTAAKIQRLEVGGGRDKLVSSANIRRGELALSEKPTSREYVFSGISFLRRAISRKIAGQPRKIDIRSIAIIIMMPAVFRPVR